MYLCHINIELWSIQCNLMFWPFPTLSGQSDKKKSYTKNYTVNCSLKPLQLLPLWLVPQYQEQVLNHLWLNPDLSHISHIWVFNSIHIYKYLPNSKTSCPISPTLWLNSVIKYNLIILFVKYLCSLIASGPHTCG